MATSADYANWLRNNQNKRGTPNYATVLRAYQEAALEESQAAQPPAPAAPAAKPESGFFPALRSGATELGGGISALLGKLGLKDEATAQAEFDAAQKRSREIFAPTEEWGLTKGLELLGGSIPYMAAPLAAGAAAAALPLTGTLAAGTALGAAGLTSAAQFTATNLSRQMEEGKKLADTDLGYAALAAVPMAVLDTAALRLIPGIGRIFGQAGIKVTPETAKEIAEQALKKTLIDYTAATGKTMGVEGLTEATQQVLERAQAGLSLTDPKARDEYFDSFIGGAVLGGTLAVPGRYLERSDAQGKARELLGAQEAEKRKAEREAEEAKKQSPEYLLDLDKRYKAAVAKKAELDAAAAKKPPTGADPAAMIAYRDAVRERDAFAKKEMAEVAREYVTREKEVAALKEQQRLAGITPQDAFLEQLGIPEVKVTPTAAPSSMEEAALEAVKQPAPSKLAAYAQERTALATEQTFGAATPKDYADYLMQDPVVAQRLVDTKTAIPGVSKKESDAILDGLKLQLEDRAKQARLATEKELQQRQADLKAQQLPAEKDPLAMWKASVEETETQAAEELLRPNFETLRPSGPATVAVAPGITPMQNPDVLLRRLDELIAAREQAAKDADTAFAAGNKELGVKKSQERETAQTALNNLEQTKGPGRALLALRKAQDAALMDAAQLADDLRVGRTLGGPEAGTASSTPQTLINQLNKQRDAFITAAVQEAAATRRLFAKALTQEEAETAAKQMRDVFNEWVTRSMAQPAEAVNWVDQMLAQMQAEKAVAGKDLSGAPWVQAMKQDFIRAQINTALMQRLGRQRMEEIAKGTAELKGAETELPEDTRRAIQSKASVDFDRLLKTAQKKALEQSTDPRPLEERRFGAYRAATAVLQEQLQGIAANLKEVPRAPRRVEPTLKMQFPETEAAKVAEASGETAKTLEGALRRRRDYVSGLIDQALQTRKVPGIAKMLLTRAQDFISNATNSFLDAAENIASRILRGQNIERSDLVTLRDEIRAAAMRPGEAEVAGEREGQRELFPAEERRALAPKAERGALGTIREKPAAFEAVRAKAAAKQQRADAAAARGEKLTQDIKRELERIDTERQQALEARVEERRDALQSAWQSAVKKAKDSIVAARRIIQKDKLKGLKTEIDAIRSGGIEGLNKETLDRLSALRQQADDLVTQFDSVVEAAEFLPLAQANKWVAFERGALDQAQKALEADRTPQTVSALAQQQTALRRAETARLQNLKGEEKAAEAARMRAAQQGLGLPGVRREAGKVTPIEPEQTAEQKRAEAEERRQQSRQETAAAKAARDEEREELEQKVTDLTAQVESAEAAQKRARTPASKARLQTTIDTLNKDLTLAKGQLEALGETKPRKKGPATVISGAGLARQRPLRTGYRKALEAAAEGMRREKTAKETTQAAPWFAATPSGGVFEQEEFIDVGGKRINFSRGATANPSTTDSVRTELKTHFPDLGRVQIYDSVEALVKANPQYEGRIPDDARGFVDRAGNKAFLIAGNINQGQALSVLLHEVGAHIGMKNLLGDAQYNAFVNAVERWQKAPATSAEGRVARAAQARVEAAETPESQQRDELLAYAVEEAVNAGITPQTKSPLGQWLGRIVQRMEAAVRKFFGMEPKGISLRDLVNTAYGAAKVEMQPAVASASAPQPAEAGEILFSRNLPTASRVASNLVGEQKGFVDKLRDNFLGMGFRTQYIDKLFPTEEALKRGGVSDKDAMQAMYYLRMHDQRMHLTSQAATVGVPERVEKTRRDGTKEFLIEAKDGANLNQAFDILKRKDVVKEAGSADAANKLVTLYMAAIRGERVGYDTLNFGRAWASAEIARIEGELKSPKLSAEQRTNLTKRKDRLSKRLDSMPSPADIKAAKAEIDANPVLREAFNEVRDIYNQYNRDLLNFNVQTGAISRELANKLLQESDYIPYYRVRDGVAELLIGKETPIRIGNLKDSPHLQELVGGDEPVMDFITSSIQNTSMLIDMATHNLAMRNLMFEFRDVGLATIGKTKGGKAPEGAVTFKVDGVEHYGVVDTEMLGISSDLLVKGLAGIPTMFPTMVRVMGMPARFLRRLIVASPVYMARQLFRDSLGASIASGANTIPLLSALKQIGKTDVLEKRGITGGQVFTGMPEDMSRMIKDMQAGKISFNNGLAWLESKAAQADALTRRSQYESYLQQGLSEMEATYMALESMNFSRRGLSPSIHMASALIPFFNTQIQGLDVLYRSFRGKMPMNERLNVRRKLLVRGAMLFGLSFAYALAMQDDEAYKNAKPEDKYGNWFVPLDMFGIKEPLRLPIPFELGYIFKALPEAIVNIAVNEKGAEEAQKALKHIGQQIVPGLSNFFIPQAVKPALEVAFGSSIYTGRDIEPAREQSVEPGYRTQSSTTELAKAVGEMTGFSPIKLEFLIRGYTGQMGMAAIAALSAPFAGAGEGPAPATKRYSDLPLIGTLFQPKDASGIVDLVYERMNKVRQAQETYERFVSEGKSEKAAQYAKEKADELSLASVAGAFRQQMGEITDYERRVRASNLSPERKREELDRAIQAKITLSKTVQAMSGRRTPQAAPA